jgi:hypothetical protein
MNELIKRLAKDHLLHDAKYNAYGEVIEGDYYEFDPVELVGFVKLIVRECVAICQDIDGEDSLDGRCARQDCAVEIREHFGVEE